MASLSSLLAEVRACTICEPELPFGAQPVVQLHIQSRILSAGFGNKVHASCVAFDDASGNRLRNPWVETELLAALRKKVAKALAR